MSVFFLLSYNIFESRPLKFEARLTRYRLFRCYSDTTLDYIVFSQPEEPRIHSVAIVINK